MANTSLNTKMAALGFAAAGSEPRLQVLGVLVRAGHEGLPIGEIQSRLDMAASTLAHHLRVLAAAGLVLQEKQGRSVINRADYDRLNALAGFLLNECCADARCASPEKTA